MKYLRADQLIAYFKNIKKELKDRSKPKYDDYLFPAQITTEYIAKKFGVTTVTVMNRLRELENENIIVSKKGNVKGKPKKIFVFFLKDDIFVPYTNASIGDEKKLIDFGYRELLYESNARIYELQSNGDAILTSNCVIRNISKNGITEIALPKRRTDTYDELKLYERVLRVEVNGKVLPYSSDALMTYRTSKRGPVLPVEGARESKYHTETAHIIPLEKPLEPGNSIHLKMVTHVPGCFSNLLEFEYCAIFTEEIAMKASLRIIAPKGYHIKSLKRHRNDDFKNGVIVKDGVTENRKTKVEEEINPPQVTEDTIYWEIEKPVMGYTYTIPFMCYKK